VSTSMRKHSRNALALVALLAFSPQASSVGPSPDNYIARARLFLGRLYPGLNGLLRPVIIDGSRLRDPNSVDPDTMNLFTVELCDLEPKPAQSPAACWCSDPVLTALFTFDWQTDNKELIDLTVLGPAVDGRNDKFSKEADKHPEWSDAQITAALNQAGAKYGPNHKAEFLRAFPREDLRPFVGGELEVVSADFHARAGGAVGADPTWVVRAKWHSPDGREADCTLMFEPFDGNLHLIRRMPVVPKAGGESSNGMKPRVP